MIVVEWLAALGAGRFDGLKSKQSWKGMLLACGIGASLVTGCASTPYKRSIEAMNAGRYDEAMELARSISKGDVEYSGGLFVIAQSYFELKSLEQASTAARLCEGEAARRQNAAKDDEEWGFNNQIKRMCSDFLNQKVKPAIYNSPENVAKRKQEEEEHLAKQKLEHEEEERRTKELATQAAKLRPYYGSAKQILLSAIDLERWVNRDERLSQTYLPEQEIKLEPVPSQKTDCIAIEVKLVPRSNWKEIRMDTTVANGASPSMARNFSKSWRPTEEIVWAKFDVNVRTKVVSGADSWGNVVINASNLEKERQDYFRSR